MMKLDILPKTNSITHSYQQRHEKILNQYIKNLSVPAEKIRLGMQYSLFPGGKRLRPMLVYLCGSLLNVPIEICDIISAAIEIIHGYSLVHDDLPAMDNDDTRRGKPSCHKAFDEATAILVGDGLQAFAIEILLEKLPQYLPSKTVIDITKELVTACGPSGMVSGQSLDLTQLTQKTASIEQIKNIHQLKTGRLISSCINMVLLASKATIQQKNALQGFAENLGLAFQMQDDYLDAYDTSDTLKKGRASDHENAKFTYASLYTKNNLSGLIIQTFADAIAYLTIFDNQATDLINFTKNLIK